MTRELREKAWQLAREKAPTPCYVIDESLVAENLRLLDDVQRDAGCKVLLALKGFACPDLFPLISKSLAGTTASSPDEARLAREEFGGEVHIYTPAYRPSEFPEILQCVDHIVFNTFAQWRAFKPQVEACGRPIECGIRINPQHSEVKVEAYDPCGRYSRLGTTLDAFDADLLEGIAGLHFHALCELGFDALERTLAAVEKKFGAFFEGLKWVNFGGGQLITRSDYDREALCARIRAFRERYGVDVYLEPGEAVVLDAGVLVASVLEVMRNEMEIAILDTSAAAHMPDVLEMPYRPGVVGSGVPGERAHTVRLAGGTCLAGDVIGDYSFEEPLTCGSRVVFLDMAHYTMVKNTTFNGVRLPSIAVQNAETGAFRVVRTFGYEDFRGRLGGGNVNSMIR